LFAHDLFGKPLHTFPDHALTGLLSASSAIPAGSRGTGMALFAL
jgi:hypothetical protein